MSVDAEEPLDQIGHTLIHMGVGWYHWIDVTQFTVPPAALSRTVDLWMAAPEFRDHHCGPLDPDEPPRTEHGPYLVDRVMANDFVLVDAATEAAFVRAWCWEYEANAEAMSTVERAILVPLAKAEAIWRLRPLDEAAFHDWGWVLEDFNELLILGTDGVLTVAVFGGD